jgi:hypothetical protein
VKRWWRARRWQVELHSERVFWPDHRGWRDEKYLTWTGEQDGQPITRYFEHADSFWQRTKAFLYALIPGIEPQL